MGRPGRAAARTRRPGRRHAGLLGQPRRRRATSTGAGERGRVAGELDARPAVAGDRVEIDDGDDSLALPAVGAKCSAPRPPNAPPRSRGRRCVCAGCGGRDGAVAARVRARQLDRARPCRRRCRSRRGRHRCCRGGRRRRSLVERPRRRPRRGSGADAPRPGDRRRETRRTGPEAVRPQPVARTSSRRAARPRCRARGQDRSARAVARARARAACRTPAGGPAPAAARAGDA